jgi:hypothetical protein
VLQSVALGVISWLCQEKGADDFTRLLIEWNLKRGLSEVLLPPQPTLHCI